MIHFNKYIKTIPTSNPKAKKKENISAILEHKKNLMFLEILFKKTYEIKNANNIFVNKKEAILKME